jgi:hypothetical protein
MGMPQRTTGVMAAGVAGGPAEGFPLPGDAVEVGGAGALDDHQLARRLQRVFELVDALAADVDVVIQGGIRRPGDAAAVVGVEGQVEQESAGAPFGLGFFADMVYDRETWAVDSLQQVCCPCRRGAGSSPPAPLLCVYRL